MSSEPLGTQQRIQLGEGVEFDPTSDELHRASRVFKLERIPATVLLFLIERNGQVVRREEIVERVWGKNTFLDTDNSINSAIRKIRQALKDDPEQPRFIQTVTGKGYRFIAPVLEGLPAAVQPEAPVQAPQQIPALLVDVVKPSSSRRHLIMVLAFLLGAGALAYTLWFRPWARTSSATNRVMLAVLPFTNLTGDPSQDYFSDGMTEELITELGRLNPARLGVIARTSVMVYKRNPKPLDQVGRELGVEYVLEGSVRRGAGRVRVTAQLIQVKDQTHLWGEQFDRDIKELLVVQSEIARGISEEIQTALGNSSSTVQIGKPALSPDQYEAHDLYLKGRYFWNKRTAESLRKAAYYFQQVIAKDPNYPQGYAGLADTYALMSTWSFVPQNEFMPKARSAALKALAIDESLAEAHASLALISESYDYDYPGAEREFRRAIQLNPDYATAHHWYAEYLGWQGRFNEALAESERARQLDPLSLIIATDHGAIYYYARQYDQALAQFRAVLDMDPTFSRVRGMMFLALVQQGKFAEALQMGDETFSPDSPAYWMQKAYLYTRWSRPAEALRARAKFEELSAKLSPTQNTWWSVLAYIGSDKQDKAIALLQKDCGAHSFDPAGIKVDPVYDPMRSDPRFQELLMHLGLSK